MNTQLKHRRGIWAGPQSLLSWGLGPESSMSDLTFSRKSHGEVGLAVIAF